MQQQNINLLTGALQYDGLRSVFKSAGWKSEGTAQSAIAAMGSFYYKRVGTANTLIKKPVEWTWRKGVEIRSENQTFADEANQLIQNFKLVNKMSRADKLSRIGRYGILLKTYADIVPGAEEYTTWATAPALNTDIIDFRPIMEADISGIRTGQDGRVIYKINFTPPGKEKGESSQQIEVHASRVIHIADNQDESSFYGTPVIMPVINELDDLLKISGASSEGYWRYRGTFILQQNMDKEGNPVGFAKDSDEDDLMDAFKAYTLGLYSTMIMSNVTPKQIADEPVSPKEWQDAIYERIAVAMDWPMRILRGSETGERASSQDMLQWGAKIESRQELYAGPDIVKPVIDSLIISGQLQDPGEIGYSAYWPSVFSETSAEASEIGKAMAEINAKNIMTGEAPFDTDEIRIRMGFEARD